MPADKQPNREQVIIQVLDELEGPTPLETVIDRVLERKPSSAKDPRGPIRNDIRRLPSLFGAVFGDPERKIVVPVRLALPGIRFRHRVTDAEVSDRGLHWTMSDAAYLASPYWPASFVHSDPALIDAHGVVIRGAAHARDISVSEGEVAISLIGEGRKLPAFMREHKVASGDSLLFTIEQFDPPRWRVDHEPVAQRDQAAIDRRNEQLMDALFAILESATREEIDMPTALYSAHLQIAEPYGYPGDPWLDAMAADGRMAPSGRGIVYADTMRVLSDEYDPPQFIFQESTGDLAEDDDEFGGEEDGEYELPPLPEADARRIYTFKVSALYRKNVWRRVEVQGDLLLADLNGYLVDLFNHDSDHMAAFSKLVRRGGKRRREVEVALVDPFGLGPGSELRIAELDLIEGDMLKWLFDFGTTTNTRCSSKPPPIQRPTHRLRQTRLSTRASQAPTSRNCCTAMSARPRASRSSQSGTAGCVLTARTRSTCCATTVRVSASTRSTTR